MQQKIRDALVPVLYSNVYSANRVFLFTIVGVFLLQSPVQGSWRTLVPPEQHVNYYLAAADSVSDFWVFNRTGELFHFSHSHWERIKSPLSESGFFGSLKTRDERMYAVMIDSAYHTHAYRLYEHQWQKMDRIAEVPVRHLIEVQTGEIYAFGDWGALYQLEEKNWRKIITPFENHITAMTMTSDSTMWFAVRNKGIYRWRGQQFVPVPVPDDVHYDILQVLELDSGTLVFLAADGTIYQYNGARFIGADTTLRGSEALNFYSKPSQPDITQAHENKLYRYNADGWHAEPLPTKRAPISVRYLPEGGKVLTTQGGGIFIREPTPQLHFIEQAAELYIEGNLLDNSTGAAFLDFNADSYLDLFVLNSGENQFNRIYLNSAGGLFTEISGQTGMDTISHISNYAFEDFDRNGSLDAVFATTHSNSTELRFYKNTGSHKFQQYSRRTIPYLTLERNVDLEWVSIGGTSGPGLFGMFYYSMGRNTGRSIYLTNRLWGHLQFADSSRAFTIRGWNRDATFADLNQDEIPDISIANFWRENRILLSGPGQVWREYNFNALTDSTETNSIGTIAIDYDVDGDLDLIEQSQEFGLRVLINDLKSGRFEARKIHDISSLQKSTIRSVNSGDLNNDGYPDLVATGESNGTRKMWVLLNQAGERFKGAEHNYGIREAEVGGVILGDIDNDGDLDLYGIGEGANQLWVNQLNTANFIQVDLRTSRSPTSGKGTKIWGYEPGHMGEQEFLVGYQQVGSNNFSTNLYNSSIVHLGTGSFTHADIRVRFPNGVNRIISSVESGQRIIVREYNKVFSALFLFPGKLMGVLRNQAFYLYGFILLLAFGSTYYGSAYGIRKYGWNIRLAVVLVIVNFTLFWILLMLLRSESWLLKYGVPLAAVVGGYLLPLGFSHHIQHRQRTLGREEAEQKLFELLRQFSHGEWAMSTLNSLHLLSRNALHNESPKIVEQICIRGNTFRDTIQDNLYTIISVANLAGYDAEFLKNMHHNLRTIESQLERIAANGKQATIGKTLGEDIGQLVEQLRELKHKVFQHYSSDVEQIIREVSEVREEQLLAEGVDLHRYKEDQRIYCALVPEHILADIIDNCITNAMKALRSKQSKQIEIRIKQRPPKILIEIADNGIGIPPEHRNRIFESGFSGFNSTGQGLHQARKNLSAYGGRIEVKPNETTQGATILIEINEGVQS